MTNDTLTMSFDPDIELILAAYETEDDIGKILRCHLVVEGQMEKLITGFTKAKIDERTPFASKLNLLRAMGVPNKVCDACSKLNHLRNQFAHGTRPTFQLNVKQTEDFLLAAALVMPILPKSRGSFRSRQNPEARHEAVYSEANLGQRVVIAASFLSSLMGALPSLYRFGPAPKVATLAGFNP